MAANNSFASVPYLNQTGHYILKGNSSLANVINTPYRVLRSFSGAVSLQYQQAHKATEFSTSLRQFLNVLGFFFSGYAVACFAAAMLLNRIVMLPNSRSREHPFRLPGWIRTILHISVIVPMAAIIYLVESNWSIKDSNKFPLKMYYVIIWSFVVETITSVSSSQIPLESSDYTIFELSIQLYNMKNLDQEHLIAKEYMSDCIMAMLSRILIHIVEIFHVRKWRLIGSTILNIGYLTYLGRVLYKDGPLAISFSSKFRQGPKLFGILIVFVSVVCYFLACLIRLDPFHPNQTNLQELKFHSFMQNWATHVNFKGDEDFSTIISRLAMLFCAGTTSGGKSMHREFSNINIPNKLHGNYAISDTLFQAKEQLVHDKFDSKTPDNKNEHFDEPAKNWNWMMMVFSFPSLVNIIWKFVSNMFCGWKLRTSVSGEDTLKPSLAQDYEQDIIDEVEYTCDSESDGTEENMEGINDTDDSHYTWVLLQNDMNDTDENLSDDSEYIPDDSLIEDDILFTIDRDELLDEMRKANETNDKGQSSKNKNKEMTEVTLDNQIDMLDLRTPANDMGWFLSLQSIFNFHLTHAERITRSKFSVMKAQDAKKNVDTVHSEADLLCAVCKTNEREIVLWPCNCFAMCDACRISLALRGYSTCVCCRRPVDGYSKIVSISN
ncbi:similar to Saccharomyces cerevisiae YNL008C ASI3 Putative integral membrane E3 ubiquitin ligase [Maudiozyma saulgeensis]|uniref:Similar to Saccharomyces cerevisiae YNL008C ASI3 Putative integral membrane E3 ubiquitin ligase n=1 Tax=Maudiozyma saulgeensis TaxID=1789683 RepID=A0A1X7R0F0_9SACH|nr:similar to Saccharomyces cerevisiae YNL008C ASI3 Putative integral membrane E3 ubiquitin ligase [Kazachstania saulgeensis]